VGALQTRFCKPLEDLSEREAASITALKAICPPIKDAQRLLAAFRSLLSERHEEERLPFVERCQQSGISQLVGFARGVCRDFAAVPAALQYHWSQGPIEGHINRLTLLKRQL
jgi:transposase